MDDEKKYLKFGEDEISEDEFKLLAADNRDDLSNYVNSININGKRVRSKSYKRRYQDLVAALDDIGRNVISGASINDAMRWVIDTNSATGYDNADDYTKAVYEQAARYYYDQMKKATKRTKESEKSKVGALDNKTFVNELLRYISNNTFGGQEWSFDKWNELDKVNDFGGRQNRNRARKLAEQLGKFKTYIGSANYNFENSPFTDLNDLNARIDNAIAQLSDATDTADNYNSKDKNALNALGLDPDQWLGSGLSQDLYASNIAKSLGKNFNKKRNEIITQYQNSDKVQKEKEKAKWKVYGDFFRELTEKALAPNEQTPESLFDEKTGQLTSDGKALIIAASADLASILDPEPLSGTALALTGTVSRATTRDWSNDFWGSLGGTGLDVLASAAQLIPFIGDAPKLYTFVNTLRVLLKPISYYVAATSIPGASNAVYKLFNDPTSLNTDDLTSIYNVLQGMLTGKAEFRRNQTTKRTIELAGYTPKKNSIFSTERYFGPKTGDKWYQRGLPRKWTPETTSKVKVKIGDKEHEIELTPEETTKFRESLNKTRLKRNGKEERNAAAASLEKVKELNKDANAPVTIHYNLLNRLGSDRGLFLKGVPYRSNKESDLESFLNSNKFGWIRSKKYHKNVARELNLEGKQKSGYIPAPENLPTETPKPVTKPTPEVPPQGDNGAPVKTNLEQPKSTPKANKTRSRETLQKRSPLVKYDKQTDTYTITDKDGKTYTIKLETDGNKRIYRRKNNDNTGWIETYSDGMRSASAMSMDLKNNLGMSPEEILKVLKKIEFKKTGGRLENNDVFNLMNYGI